jgi:hypothetical protein
MLSLMGALSGLMLVAAPPAEADHSWNGYHWARTDTSKPFTLKVGDNVSSTWDPYLTEAISDWNKKTSAQVVLQLTPVLGRATTKQCRATTGQIEVCADKYGFNGWLGIAQVWVSGKHITQATTKLNDSYFNTSTYNTPAWRRLVLCQEIAHDFGLDHQDETFDNANLGTCMDYTNDPDGGAGGKVNNDLSNEHPNQHDYDELVAIYVTNHTVADTTTTVAQSAGAAPGRSGTASDEGPNDPSDFGRPDGPKDSDGHDIRFRRDLPNGQVLFTHVYWVPRGAPGAARP